MAHPDPSQNASPPVQAESARSFMAPPRFCEQCGARLPSDARFCEQCGWTVDVNAQDMPTEPPEPIRLTAAPPDWPLAGSTRFPHEPADMIDREANGWRRVLPWLLLAFAIGISGVGVWQDWIDSTQGEEDIPINLPPPSIPVPSKVGSVVSDVSPDAALARRDYEAALERFERAYSHYTQLVTTGGRGNVRDALQEYRSAYAAKNAAHERLLAVERASTGSK